MSFPSKFKTRLFMSIFGVFLCASAVGFFKCSGFGVDPFQCFSMGVWAKFGSRLSYGTCYTILNLLFLVVNLLLDRHNIGLATFINLFLTGYVVDFSATLLSRLCPVPGIGLRIVFLLIGIVVMCFAASLYMTADMGVSVYDALPIYISGKRNWQFRLVRIVCDCICVLTGTLCVLTGGTLGQLPGIGTIITALFMGPLVDFFNRKFSRPLLAE